MTASIHRLTLSKRLVLRAAALFCCVVGSAGCGSDGGGTTEPPPPGLVDQGWAAFESGDYAAAVSKFEQAIDAEVTNADAHNGRGWASAKLGDYATAINAYDEALFHGFGGADPHAGRAVVLRDDDTGGYPAAIAAANSALAIDSGYRFAHDTELDWRDLRVILAQSYFAVGDYDLANDQVGVLGGTMHNPASDTYVADLLAEIERLGSMFGS